MPNPYKQIISESVALGMMLHLRILSPEADRITRNRASRYLADAGFPNPRMHLASLIASGRLSVRKAPSPNARITLSATQLQTLIIEQLVANLELSKL